MATNFDNFSGAPGTIVVDPTAGKGNFTTITAALAASSSGNTIFIRPGTYTENLTLVAGVDLIAGGDEGFTPVVTIIGKCTFTAAGSVSISGIRLQTNSDFILAVTGSAASIIYLNNCYLNVTNNTAISFTSSSSSSRIFILKCRGDLTTTGITYFVSTAAGSIAIRHSNLSGSGASTTPSTLSGGQFALSYSEFACAVSTSSTGTVLWFYSYVLMGAPNTTALTSAGTGSQQIYHCILDSGTASCLSIGSGTTLTMLDTEVGSTNASAITGAGTINYSGLTFTRASSSIGTTTQSLYGISDITAATQTLVAQNVYLTDRGGGVTYTLPANGGLGDVITIVGKAGLATVAQNALQAIIFGSSTTTIGVGGSIVSTNVGDCVTLRCTTSGTSTRWVVQSSVGSWTIV